MYTHLPTRCLKVTLSISERRLESWAYFHFMICNLYTQRKLIDFHNHVTLLHLFLVSLFFLLYINFTLRMLQMCSESY